MSKVLLAGDIHGDTVWARRVVAVAKNLGCSRILQVGDFGYWEHHGSGVDYLYKLSHALVKNSIGLYFIDGNHENHTMLRADYGPGGEKHEPRGPFWKIRDGIHYVPRGSRWTWADNNDYSDGKGVHFLGCGGAYSVDKPARREGFSWWPEETITEADVRRCLDDHGSVDVLVSHDAPLDCLDAIKEAMRGGYWKQHPETERNQKALQAIVDGTKPRLVVHGHYHVGYNTTIGDRLTIGLDRDGRYESLAVLDLADQVITPCTYEDVWEDV